MRIEKFLHILNPKTPYRKAVKKFFAKIPHVSAVWVERTSHPTHLETIVEWGLLQGFTHFSVWGGDGSFNRTIQALFEQNVLAQSTLALVPVGTGNDFARQLNFPFWKKAISRLFQNTNEGEKFDLGLLEFDGRRRVFVNNSGFGRSSEALTTPRTNPFADIWTFTEKKIEVECEDGSSRQFETMRVFLGIVFNGPYFNKGLYFDKKISPSDGILQAVMVSPENRWKLLLRFIGGRMGFSLARKRDRKLEGHLIRVESSDTLYPQVDGEPAGKQGAKSLQFSIMKNGLNILMPKGA